MKALLIIISGILIIISSAFFKENTCWVVIGIGTLIAFIGILKW